VREFKAARSSSAPTPGPTCHASIGKRSFSAEDIAVNLTAFVDHLRGLKPPQAKGNFIRKVVLSTTMSPGIQLDLS
jgi:large subunit ribosomal protein L1